MQQMIIITESVVYNYFSTAEQKWESNPYIELVIDISTEKLHSVAKKLLDRLPNDLAFCILADLVERDDFPVTLLSEVYDKGDKSCKVAICLKEDLPLEIIERCENTDDPDVRTHYTMSVQKNGNAV